MAVLAAREILVLLNGPVVLISLLTTSFFFSCLLVSKRGQDEGIKQPLLLLLWSMVGSNGCVQLAVILSVGVEFTKIYWGEEYWPLVRSFTQQCSIQSTLSASAWLSLFYFIRIVPAHRPLIMWMKRNIKKIIYWGMTTDRCIIVSDVMIEAMLHSSVIELVKAADIQLDNFTSASLNDTKAKEAHQVLLYARLSFFSSHIFVLALHTLAVMLSCGATVLYLLKHMKRMQVTSSSSFSSPHLQSQMRVTIMGIVQGGLHIFCSVWIIVDDSLKWFKVNFDKEHHILNTVICLFSFGTTLNLGFGQTLFRQRASDLWSRAVQITRLCGFNRA